MLNMDMLAYSETDDLYAVGTWHYPVLLELVSAAAGESSINLRTGYDEPSDDPRNDWTIAVRPRAVPRRGHRLPLSRR